MSLCALQVQLIEKGKSMTLEMIFLMAQSKVKSSPVPQILFDVATQNDSELDEKIKIFHRIYFWKKKKKVWGKAGHKGKCAPSHPLHACGLPWFIYTTWLSATRAYLFCFPWNFFRITCTFLPFQSKWFYVGTERGNIHVVNIETFVLSGYIINWNKAIEV